MPAPKAVLRDINDLGLDPKKAYNETTSGGRLSGNSLHSNPIANKVRYAGVEPEQVSPPPSPPQIEESVVVKNALVDLTPIDHITLTFEAKSEEKKEDKLEVAKKNKQPKKAEKKDAEKKSEDPSS